MAQGGADPVPRRRRRRHHAVTIVVALALLVIIGGGGYRWARQPTTASTPAACPSATPAAPVTALRLPKPSSVVLTVLNATQVTGLAHRTAVEFGRRGFRIADVGDAGVQVAGTEVRYGPGASAAGWLVALQLPHARMVSDSTVPPGQVDLVLGPGFTGLRSVPAAVAAAWAARHAGARARLVARSPAARANPLLRGGAAGATSHHPSAVRPSRRAGATPRPSPSCPG